MRCAASDFVEDDQSAAAGLVEDGGGFDHFDHEGRTAARKIVGRTHAAEEAVDNADPGRGSGHETAHLGHDGDERVLAQEGRFTGHVGPGQQPQAGLVLQTAIVGDEGLAGCRVRQRLDHGMAPADRCQRRRRR